MKQTVQDLHKQHNLFDDQLKLYLVHQFDQKLRSWKFNGYRCVYCGSNFKYGTSIEKHPEVCRILNKTSREYNTDHYDKVLTVEGKQWQPQYEAYTFKNVIKDN